MDITLAKNQTSGKIAVVSRHQSGVIRAVVMDQKTGQTVRDIVVNATEKDKRSNIQDEMAGSVPI